MNDHSSNLLNLSSWEEFLKFIWISYIHFTERYFVCPILSVIILVINQIGLLLCSRPLLLITSMITARLGIHSVLLKLLINNAASVYVTITYHLALYKAVCYTFAPACCFQHTSCHLVTDGGWCRFLYAPFCRLHMSHYTCSRLQSHSSLRPLQQTTLKSNLVRQEFLLCTKNWQCNL